MNLHTLNLLGAVATGCSDYQAFAMAEVGLAPAELAALLAVHSRPGSTVGDVALTTGLTHSGAVRVIDRLSELHWVERRVGRDRRKVAIHCTREGRKKAKLALSYRERALQDLTRGILKTDLTAFSNVAKEILSRLPDNRSDAWRICRLCDHTVCQGDSCPVGTAI